MISGHRAPTYPESVAGKPFVHELPGEHLGEIALRKKLQ
jgi:hypothetical protein